MSFNNIRYKMFRHNFLSIHHNILLKCQVNFQNILQFSEELRKKLFLDYPIIQSFYTSTLSSLCIEITHRRRTGVKGDPFMSLLV